MLGSAVGRPSPLSPRRVCHHSSEDFLLRVSTQDCLSLPQVPYTSQVEHTYATKKTPESTGDRCVRGQENTVGSVGRTFTGTFVWQYVPVVGGRPSRERGVGPRRESTQVPWLPVPGRLSSCGPYPTQKVPTQSEPYCSHNDS